MAPFSIPTPSIIPLRLPVFGGPKSIDTQTKIQILCETYLEHEIFYTVDGTKPQPYAGIVQGNKTIKYTSPFCLSAGKITIKAMAISSAVHTMCSSTVTKCFNVKKVESTNYEDSRTNKSRGIKSKKNSVKCENKKNSNESVDEKKEKLPEISDVRLDCDTNPENETLTNCLEEAFIGSTDFELDSNEDDTEDIKCLPVHENRLDINDNLELPELKQSCIVNASCGNDSLSQAMEKLTLETDKSMNKTNAELTDSGTSIGSQFCCLKCDLTLQQCNKCNKVNSVSSKFCMACGEQLLQICHFCKEWNSIIATFCQFCGKKLGTRMDPYIRPDQVDQSIMAKPESKSIAVQVLPVRAEKCTQTVHERNSGKRSSSGSRRMPPISPGRGYWHQQLDYICNHLKSHAYNNVEFRQEISEPSLCDFKSAHIIKEENNIIVSLSFTPYVSDKSAAPTSEEKKTGDKYPESS